MTSHRIWLALGLSFTLVATSPGATLVERGQSRTVIVVPDEASEFEALAAKELVDVLGRISGATIEQATVSTLPPAKKTARTPIFVGRAAEKRPKTPPSPTTRGAFILDATNDSIALVGSEEGPYYAAIELLEQLGCRWFMPGPLGEVIPKLDTVEVRTQRTEQTPSFPSRWFQMPDRDWQMRVRCGGPVFPGGHGLPLPKVSMDKASGEIRPAEMAPLFALVKGKRTTRQHCLSNPEVLRLVVEASRQDLAKGKRNILGMGPNDGAGFCECEQCRALDADDFDPFSNEHSVTDRYIWFFNQVLAALEPDYPDVKIAFYIYHSYMRPPKRYQPNPRITGALAPIALDRVHGFSNPIAPEKSYARWLFQEWGKIMPELYDRGYWSNLACPGFPFVIVDRLRDEIPVCHALGVKGWRVETFPNYGPQFPSMYVAGKLMWNHETNVDALLDDCFEKFFGPAAEPMGQYLRRMDAALRDGDYCTGSAWDMPHFYPPKFRAEMRALVLSGLKAARDQGIYAERVRMIGETLEMLDAFCDMQQARVHVDFPAAQQALTRLDTVAEKLMTYEPTPMLSAGRFSTYTNYMRRFFRLCTEQGYRRVTEGNQLIAAAQDEWQFQIDPARVGEEIGLFRPEARGGGWQTLRTSSSSWSNQGLRYYKGLAWYRQELDVPAKFAGQRVYLWCGGVDETAKVWLNGQLIGISHGAAFYPFEMDATPAVKAGKNTLVVCVANLVVSELGTGGIVAPVMLYAPAAGNEAKLENFRDLKPTFP